MIRPTEVFFHLPVAELTSEERASCLTLYALYFNRDGLSDDQTMAIIKDWLAEYGSSEAAIEALRKRVRESMGRG